MNREAVILCLCARQTFGESEAREVVALCKESAVDWAHIFRAAESHLISPLVNVNLERAGMEALGVPPPVRRQFKTAHIHNVLLAKGTQRALTTALACLTSEGLDVMLVKGGALNAFVYERPWYMISGDVDLILRTSRPELTPAQSRAIREVEALNRRRNEFQAFIEFDFLTHHDITMNDVLAVDASDLWDVARPQTYLGHNVYFLPPEETLLAAAINSCRKRFLRLKALCDVATIVTCYPDLDWARLSATAQRWQAHSIVYTALYMARASIGCSVPDGVLDSLGVPVLRRRLIHSVVDHLVEHALISAATWSDHTLMGRQLSRSLLLTYAAYPLSMVWRKARRVITTWRQPPPAIPPPVAFDPRLRPLGKKGEH